MAPQDEKMNEVGCCQNQGAVMLLSTMGDSRQRRQKKSGFCRQFRVMSITTVTVSVVVLSYLASHLCVSGFNVDVNSRVIHNAPTDSCYNDCMFGFSVAQHREKGVPW